MAGAVYRWKSLGRGARVSLIAGITIIVAFAVFAFWWLASEEYQVLFADLEPSDAAKVLKTLEEMKVDYRLAAGGTQIQVPESSVHEVRLKVMGSGVPLVGGAGFEIFNDSDFGMTEFSQRINYQRALEGELTRTIVSLKEVKYARVHLVMPDRGLFKQNDSFPSASVTLFLHPGNGPLARQIMGIQRLVAAAVPMLKPSQVTVTDQNGLTLSQQLSAQEGVATAAGRLQQKQAAEEYLMAKANEVVIRHFGARQALVSIDVELDCSQVKRTRENVLPLSDQKGAGVVRRRETRKDVGTASKERQGNITTEVEYRLGRDIEQIVETPGRILRLSVGIMVPSTVPEQQLEGIRELVKMAVGFDSSRGDSIAIYAMSNAFHGFEDEIGDTHKSTLDRDQSQPITKESSSMQIPENPKVPIMGGDLAPFKKWFSLFKENLRWVLVVGIAITILGAAVIIISLRGKTGDKPETRLSDSDRQRILEDVQRWLHGVDKRQESEIV